MLLAVDIGNTNITFGIFDKKELIASFRLNSNQKQDSESYAIAIIEEIINQTGEIPQIKNTIIASVVPNLSKIIKEACNKFTAKKVIVVGDDKIKFNIKTDLKDESEIGIDRLINSYMAHKKFTKDLIIIDFGTATTFDVVSDKGVYLGGVIAPGVNLSIKALHEMTAKLPNIKVKKQENVIGKSTLEAINSGIYFGYISLIEGLISRIKKEYGKKMEVVSTGGLSSLFSSAIDQIDYVENDLILDGLNLIFQENLERDF